MSCVVKCRATAPPIRTCVCVRRGPDGHTDLDDATAEGELHRGARRCVQGGNDLDEPVLLVNVQPQLGILGNQRRLCVMHHVYVRELHPGSLGPGAPQAYQLVARVDRRIAVMRRLQRRDQLHHVGDQDSVALPLDALLQVYAAARIPVNDHVSDAQVRSRPIRPTPDQRPLCCALAHRTEVGKVVFNVGKDVLLLLGLCARLKTVQRPHRRNACEDADEGADEGVRTHAGVS